MTPSTSRDSTQGATWAAVRAAATQPAKTSPTRNSTPSERKEPMGPKVMANMASIMRRNTGMARYLWVTMASILSERVRASRGLPFTTAASTTLWMN